MKRMILCFLWMAVQQLSAQSSLQKMEAVNFSKVNITDHFWKPKIDTVVKVTIPVCINQTEIKTPRIRNFQKVARKKGEKHEGIYYDDSDVFKALEAMAYALQNGADTALQNKIDAWIDIIAAAQQPDGYLNTYFTLNDVNKRWTDIEKHEDYNAGHLIEAAVAYYNVSGKRKLLDVAIRVANNIDSTFRLQNRYWISGHEEIELALVKLYKATNDDRYLKLADWYLQQRGHGYNNGKGWGTPAYWQDILPVKEQNKITGHAVRAMYLYTGAADVAVQTGDAGYVNAMKKVWEDVVYRNMYVTGGIGSAGTNEGFSVDYDLPNEQAYCETCASVGMVLWNQRMNLLTGESKYMDVLERVLYNGALDGLSLSGDKFFYDNPLASTGEHQRAEWFGTACCPANIARLVTSLGNYIYARSSNSIYVNLFVGSNTVIPLDKTSVSIKTETNYPWDGDIKIKVDPLTKANFNIAVRIPGWVNGAPVPGDLYHFADSHLETVVITVNGKEQPFHLQNGYAVISRIWNKGDVIEYSIPMRVHQIVSKDSVPFNRERIALQRGPLVYCVEGKDNSSNAFDFIVPDQTAFSTKPYQILNERVTALTATVPFISVSNNGTTVQTENKTITAIPYYTWCNRGNNQMQVWLPTKIKEIKLNY